MKQIKVFIASSEELKLERLEFVSMVHHLNGILEPRGIQIMPVEWEYLDASMNAERKQTEYNNALRQCEMCLVLFWTKLGSYTEEELNTAYEGLKAGENPRKLYVYFKETPGEITPELKDFKGSFATKYGHFYCKFENVDTMRLNFLLQFEQYQNTHIGQEEMIRVKDSQVELYGQKVADLRNVPFAGNNPDYRRMQEDLQKLQQEIVTFETIQATTPNDAIATLLQQKYIDRERLTKELEGMEKSLMETAKQIVSLSYTASSARLQKAIELFEQGDNKGANAVLDFDEIKAEMVMNAQRIDDARELEKKALDALMSNIEECKLKVKTLQTEKQQGWLQQCIDVYEDALRNATGRIPDEELAELRFDYARMLSDNNQFNKAVELYEQNVELYRKLADSSPEAYLPGLAGNIGNLANLHNDLHRYEESEAEYTEAIGIYLKLADTSPEAYLPKIALNVGNLAYLHSILHRYEESEAECAEAIGIYRKLMETSPEAYLPKIALNVGNLALLHSDLHRYEESEQEYTEAIGILRKLTETSPEAYLPDLARTVGNLANLHKNLHCYEESEQEYTEAIGIYRKLAETSPEAYLPYVACTVGNLALLHSDLHRYEEAEEEYTEAIAIYRKLADTSPEAYLPDVARNVGNLAILHGDLHRYEESEQEYTEAIGIYRKLAETSPEAYLPKIALNVGNLALLHSNLHRYEEAEEEYTEAIAIYRKLADTSPEAYLPDVACTVGNLAILHSDLHRYEESEEEYTEAIGIYRKLAETSPEAYLPDVARNVGNLALLHSNLHRYEESEQEYTEAIGIYRELADKYPEVYLQDLAWNMNTLAYCYWKQDKHDDALRTIDEAITALPNNPNILDSKGELLMQLGRTDEALEIYHRILEIDEEFFNNDSDFYKALKEHGLIG